MRCSVRRFSSDANPGANRHSSARTTIVGVGRSIHSPIAVSVVWCVSAIIGRRISAVVTVSRPVAVPIRRHATYHRTRDQSARKSGPNPRASTAAGATTAVAATIAAAATTNVTLFMNNPPNLKHVIRQVWIFWVRCCWEDPTPGRCLRGPFGACRLGALLLAFALPVANLKRRLPPPRGCPALAPPRERLATSRIRGLFLRTCCRLQDASAIMRRPADR
jgi:hypothetical protein